MATCDHTTNEKRSATEWRQRLTDASHDLCQLVGMIEGASVLYERTEEGVPGDPLNRRAANALIPMFETIIREATRINEAVDRIESETRHG